MKSNQAFFSDSFQTEGELTVEPIGRSAGPSWKILIVDDETDVHEITRIALRRLVFEDAGLEFHSAFSAEEARAVMQRHPDIAVILLDVVMEEENAGLQLIRYIRNTLGNRRVRIILRTGHLGQAPEDNVTMEYDINDYREKSELTARSLRTAVLSALRSFRDIATIAALNREVEETQYELICALGEIAESRSVDSGCHVRRVGEISGLLAEKCGLPPEQISLLRLAAPLHDLGKIAIHDSILNKRGPLTAEEFHIMKQHAKLGYELLRNSKRALLELATTIAKEHHENFDGSGYPDGLKEQEINLCSRIVAVADVFDALGMRRVYKEPWPRDKILAYIREERNKKFDPWLVDIVLENSEEFFGIRERFPDPEFRLENGTEKAASESD